ncbi:hypothetical protein MOO45_01135 [Bombilactobacillus folatiphilus]|uniref:WxL domain-containing protein n=1 Tax=Bombilactobacillus folatiphilus TaxID=2923362 RepID=A0ABY4P9M0_9LACO|nr:pectate lyase-like adhesive domain-containing protein [Bombilactobacillus folatiphilus]UQS82327.1 hypothetical protein MOO45_01135 [Bombilactobacillus folatiphilus]
MNNYKYLLKILKLFLLFVTAYLLLISHCQLVRAAHSKNLNLTTNNLIVDSALHSPQTQTQDNTKNFDYLTQPSPMVDNIAREATAHPGLYMYDNYANLNGQFYWADSDAQASVADGKNYFTVDNDPDAKDNQDDFNYLIKNGENLGSSATYTAYVSTAQGFLEAVYDEDSPDAKNDNVSHISKIVIKNDLDLSKDYCDYTGYRGLTFEWNYTRHFKMDIEGNNHSIEFADCSIALISNGSSTNKDSTFSVSDAGAICSTLYKEDWTLKDLHAYDQSYWGPIAANNGVADNAQKADEGKDNNYIQRHGGFTRITYDNFTDVGAQTHNGYSSKANSDIVIKDRVDLSSVKSYKYNGKVYESQDKNQQIFEASNITFSKGCLFTGYTYDASGITLSGSTTHSEDPSRAHEHNVVKLEDGAKVYLFPHGDASAENSGDSPNINMPYAITSIGNNSKIELHGNSELYMISNDAPPKGQYYTSSDPLRNNHSLAGGLYVGGKCDVEYHKDSTGSPILRVQSNDDSTMDYNNPQNNVMDDDGNFPAGRETNSNAAGDANVQESSYSNAMGDAHSNYGQYISPDTNSTGATLASKPLVYLGGAGSSANLDNGTFSVQTHNLHDFGTGNSSNSIGLSAGRGQVMDIASGMKVTINKDGIFNLKNTGASNTGGAIILLYADNGMDLNIYNPEKINLDLGTNNNPNSDIVYVNGGSATSPGGSVNVFNSTFSASGNSSAISGPSGSLGTGNNDDVTLDNVPIQKLEVPFAYWAIMGNLLQDGTKDVYASKDNLAKLNIGLAAMNGKEFHQITFGKLDSPLINNATDDVIPAHSMDIKGTISHYDNDTAFTPATPLLHLSLVRQDGSTYDLGTVNNSQQSYWGYTDSSNNAITKPVSPGILGVGEDGKQNGLVSSDRTGDVVLTAPLYLNDGVDDADHPDDQDVKITQTASDPKSSVFDYTIDFANALKKYNEFAEKPDSGKTPINDLKSSDKLMVSAVTNYQETPLQTVNVTNLFLSTGDSKDVLLGDEVAVPLSYYDGDPNAKKLHLNGTVIGDGTSKTVTTGDDPLNITHPADKKDVPTTWNIADVTDKVGQHTLSFDGKDDIDPANPYPTSGQLTYDYNVLPFPKYQGTKKLSHLNEQTYTDGDQTIHTASAGNNKLVTTFKPVGHHDLAEVKLSLHQPTSGAITTSSAYQITASYPDTTDSTKTVTKTITEPMATNDGVYTLTANDFGFGVADFPVDTTFTIQQDVNVTGDIQSLFSSAADTLSTIDSDGAEHVLATTNAPKNWITNHDVELFVPQKLNYTAKLFDKKKDFYPDDSEDKPEVELKNNFTGDENITLIAKYEGESTDDKVGPLLMYGSCDNAQSLEDDVTIDKCSLAGSTSKKINLKPSSPTETTGLFIQVPDDGSHKLNNKTTYKGKVTWSLSNSIS